MKENEFTERLRKMTDDELIETFNQDVGRPGVVSARFRFHDAMKKEFISRSFDFSGIGGQQTLSWAHKIKLDGKRINIVESQK